VTTQVTIELTEAEAELLRASAADVAHYRPERVAIRKGDIRLPLIRRIVAALPEPPVKPEAGKAYQLVAAAFPDYNPRWRSRVEVVALADGSAWIRDGDGDLTTVDTADFTWVLVA
jgi:hypothetical protein